MKTKSYVSWAVCDMGSAFFFAQLSLRGEAGKETYSLQTLRNYKQMTFSKFLSKESMQKKFSCRIRQDIEAGEEHRSAFNENKTIWKPNMSSGASLGASFTVIMFKKRKFYKCLRKVRFLSHSSTSTLIRGQSQHSTYCREVQIIIMGKLMVIGNYGAMDGSSSSLSGHSSSTSGIYVVRRRLIKIQATSSPKTYGQKLGRRILGKKENSIG